jgi:hypothetical protein
MLMFFKTIASLLEEWTAELLQQTKEEPGAEAATTGSNQ